MQKDIRKKAAKPGSVPLRVTKTAQRTTRPATGPDKFTYALAAYTAERGKDGWFIAKSVPSFTGEKPKWSGPFETIETACLAIARRHATEIADRHTRSVEAHKIGRDDPRYGLKPMTRLNAR